jgi:hypothetical protein
MTLDFRTKGVVKVSMIEYIDEITQAMDAACKEFDDGYKTVTYRNKIHTAAPDDLFKVNVDEVKLSQAQAKAFHNIVAKALYAAKRSRPDIALAVAFLTTRVREPDVDDWRKLTHLNGYLKATRELPLVLGAVSTGVLHWHVDASFAVHPNMRGHTGGTLTMGRGCPISTSTKQKLNTKVS